MLGNNTVAVCLILTRALSNSPPIGLHITLTPPCIAIHSVTYEMLQPRHESERMKWCTTTITGRSVHSVVTVSHCSTTYEPRTSVTPGCARKYFQHKLAIFMQRDNIFCIDYCISIFCTYFFRIYLLFKSNFIPFAKRINATLVSMFHLLHIAWVFLKA